MKTLKIYVEDESARACLVCFNRPFLEKQFPVGTRARLFGHFYYKYGEIQSSSFELEPAGSVHGPILPVYPLTAGLTQGLLRKLIRQAVSRYASHLEDELPLSVITRDGLFHKADAVRVIHFPASQQELERAKKTLVYEELFYLEVMVVRRSLQRKSGRRGNEEAPQSKEENKEEDFSSLQKSLLERLPFALTLGQSSAVAEINRDMNGPYPMARLLQGDVGSGKTLVSFLAALKAVEAGGQAALMAPTVLLARQHAESAARLLEPIGIRIAFLTGNLKASGRANLLKALSSGEIDMIAGTHALFSRDVEYKNLRLVTVDEQHRFGVLQRQAITAKGRLPDL
jgi:ATP-dependent DNA helicase RecG